MPGYSRHCIGTGGREDKNRLPAYCILYLPGVHVVAIFRLPMYPCSFSKVAYPVLKCNMLSASLTTYCHFDCLLSSDGECGIHHLHHQMVNADFHMHASLLGLNQKLLGKISSCVWWLTDRRYAVSISLTCSRAAA